MCRTLELPRSSYYYEESPKPINSALENAVIEEFRKSRNNYGTRKLKIVLGRRGFTASKRFYSVDADLRQINLFHTDRGSEFKNHAIEQILDAFGIRRSLSARGSPYDNAVAESIYNIIKTEFVFTREYADLAEFKLFWFDYVNWYNNVRIHGSLDYTTPNQWHLREN